MFTAFRRQVRGVGRAGLRVCPPATRVLFRARALPLGGWVVVDLAAVVQCPGRKPSARWQLRGSPSALCYRLGAHARSRTEEKDGRNMVLHQTCAFWRGNLDPCGWNCSGTGPKNLCRGSPPVAPGTGRPPKAC
jgi:hypothetical protein